MPLTLSASAAFSDASGSLLKGAPARAASRCQASASAMLILGGAISAWPLWAHSAATASWPFPRLISSSRSRSRRAAPLSRPLSSRNTSCICSALGLPASQSRTRAARSPDVGAVKAPPVSVSSACVSWFLVGEAWVTGMVELVGTKKENGRLRPHPILAANARTDLPGGPKRESPDGWPEACPPGLTAGHEVCAVWVRSQGEIVPGCVGSKRLLPGRAGATTEMALPAYYLIAQALQA